jgi:peptide chain release factor 3
VLNKSTLAAEPPGDDPLTPASSAAGAAALERRTFAIISHPDAGKTTLTEKLLHTAGAVREAGEVRARGSQRRARSDWMAIEQQRGISVTSSVMTFERDGILFNLLDTPGHQDFSEDTYRTLTAVDSAIMVIDAAKGIEAQTRKLFEVCRLRNVPIITFINKVDREGLSPFALMDEVAETLQLDVSPRNWPAGMGGLFGGIYDLEADTLALADTARAPIRCSGLDDELLDGVLSPEAAAALREEAGLAQAAYPDFDPEAFRAGDMTPVYFGSALREIGVDHLFEGLVRYAPPPGLQPALPAPVDPAEERVTGFIFKMQANMDPNHRDRVAFMRICSGTLRRGIKLHNARLGKAMAIHNPVSFFARDRELAGAARPGDIIGIPNHGTLRVGDTLFERGEVRFTGLPNFAPEILRRVRLDDPMKTKQMRRGLSDLAEEGVVRVFRPLLGSQWIVGVVGELQLDVLATRIEQEYGLRLGFEASPHDIARWIAAPPDTLKRLIAANRANIAEDQDDAPVLMMRNAWEFGYFQQQWPDVEFLSVRERD